MKRALLLGLAGLLGTLALTLPARAHDNAPGVLAIVETDHPGVFRVAYSPPVDTRDSDVRVTPRYPAHCTLEEALLRCGDTGLVGALDFAGLEGSRMRVVISLQRRDHDPVEFFASSSAPSIALTAPPAGLGDWIGVGLEHVVFGPDHLAFLLGLLLVSKRDRSLLLTVTAFTLAHSVTLALAALDVVRLAPRPVEACIALSILLVARESLSPEMHLTRRAPWLIAGAFGLIHGFGFASALDAIGLPRHSIGGALLGFNLGVEVGQLAIVALSLALTSPWVRSPHEARLRAMAGYALGSLGAYWLIARVWAIASALIAS